jgi:acyl carrier protein phosphodiesterase
MADAVKGNRLERYRDGLRNGIRLHREIDHYTDTHPVARQSRERLMPVFHKFSGVIVDIFYDHYLARNWTEYSDEPLATFTRRNYQVLMRHYFILPPRSKRILLFMMQGDWLSSYAGLDGLDQSLRGLARRAGNASGMEHAVKHLEKDYNAFGEEFRMFFPELTDYARRIISVNGAQ